MYLHQAKAYRGLFNIFRDRDYLMQGKTVSTLRSASRITGIGRPGIHLFGKIKSHPHIQSPKDKICN